MAETGGKRGIVGAILREVGFNPEIESDREPDRGTVRAVASAVLVVTGVVLLIPNVTVLLTGPVEPVGTVLSLLGTIVSTGLVAAGYSLYHSNFSNRNAIRIAIWNVLGLVVLGAVMAGLFAYQRNAGAAPVDQAFTIANLLAIGAAAHVVIGVYDARRVRAEELAAERRKLAVLNRVIRHNLRNEATVMLGHAEQIAATADDESVAASAETLMNHVETVGDLADEADTVMSVYDRRGRHLEERSVREDATSAVQAVAEEHPEADLSVDVPEGLTVRSDPALPDALRELVENGVVHGADEPTVSVRAAREDGWIAIEIRDDGPGIPEEEYQVVTGDSEITQLTHGSGLGLWVAQAVVDAANGRLDFGAPDEGGAVVTLRLPPA
ncbi:MULTISPECIES: sensor histidine kinase [Halolamina]|uniref:histidine kinase n=1 Tax=Halolamina pelagica TaxID=699431 RepID=A0A1I5RMV8_9EURY|nr:MULTISPECIES: HAMP domain-containing sensor histidine kinase [Halolamina]NHX35258.1 HAMP domain-containing histidine kinase [Halolamina sp. R1-12]SFP59707.1 4TM region of histidine kinase [Halolamina pelagica]